MFNMHFSMAFSLTLGAGRAAQHPPHSSMHDNNSALPHASREDSPLAHGRNRKAAFTSATYLRDITSHNTYYSETRNITETAWSRQMDQVSLETLLCATGSLHAAQHKPAATGEKCTEAVKSSTTFAAKKHTAPARLMSADATLVHGAAPGWVRQSSLGSDWSSVVGGEDTSSGKEYADARFGQQPTRQLLTEESHAFKSAAADINSSPSGSSARSAGVRRPVEDDFFSTSHNSESSAEQQGIERLATSTVDDEDANQSEPELMQHPAFPAKASSPAKSTMSQDEKNILTFLEDLAGSRACASRLSSEQGKRTQCLSRASSFLPHQDIVSSEPETSPGPSAARVAIKQAKPEGSENDAGSKSITDLNAKARVTDRGVASVANKAEPVRQSSLSTQPTEASDSEYDVLNSSIDEIAADEDARSIVSGEVVHEEWEWTDAAELLQEV